METKGYTATTTLAQYGESKLRSYLYIENQGTDNIYFGFGDTAPTHLHNLGPGLSMEWSFAVPSKKLWLASAVGTATVVLTD